MHLANRCGCLAKGLEPIVAEGIALGSDAGEVWLDCPIQGESILVDTFPRALPSATMGSRALARQPQRFAKCIFSEETANSSGKS